MPREENHKSDSACRAAQAAGKEMVVFNRAVLDTTSAIGAIGAILKLEKSHA